MSVIAGTDSIRVAAYRTLLLVRFLPFLLILIVGCQVSKTSQQTPDSGANSAIKASTSSSAIQASQREREVDEFEHGGVTTGPRGIVVNDEELEDITEVAARCKKSSWLGISSVATDRCPAGCVIIIDGMCAGPTPAKERAVGPGSRTVSVVCNGKVFRTGRLQFEPKRTTTFHCKD